MKNMSLKRREEERLIETVDYLSDDVLDFTCRLVEQASILGNEIPVVEVMERKLASLNLEPIRVPVDYAKLSTHPGFAPVAWDYAGRFSVVATRPADGNGGKSALFNGHLDVVSPEPLQLWNTDPFEPTIRDRWLYGRGAGDMKSGVAAMTYALLAVEKAGFGLRAPVTLEGVIEEECGGNGALACVAAGFDAEAVLIPEPFGPTIMTSQVGVVWFKVTVTGASGHVQDAGSHVNAIDKCLLLIEGLKELEAEMNRESHPAYEGMDHPLNLNIGVIRGGDWPSSVPGLAEFVARLGFFPGVDFHAIKGRIQDAIDASAQADPWLKENPPEVDFYGFRSEGHTIPRDLPALVTLNQCHRSLTGTDAAEYPSTCYTDVRAFQFFARGQATCFGPVAQDIHAPNERVLIDSVIHTAKVYTLFLARWCGLTE